MLTASLLAKWIFASSIGWAAGLALGILFSLVAAKLPWLNEDRFFFGATDEASVNSHYGFLAFCGVVGMECLLSNGY